MLADIDGVVDNVKSRLPEGAEVLRTIMEPHLRHYLNRAKSLRNGETR
jgi:ribonucleotide monophosphatase NagD (HAD superfamily)